MSLSTIYINHINSQLRSIFVAIVLFSTAIGSYAQEYCQHWITNPYAESASQIWYRKQIIPTKKIKRAYVSISTNGYTDIYANARNVSRYCLNPYREQKATTITTATYNISPYTNSDTLTIAIWYSPLSFTSHNDKQISVVVWGRYTDETAFSFVSNDSWLCRPANTSININEGEDINGNIDQYQWKSHSNYSLALWQRAKETKYKPDNTNTTIYQNSDLHHTTQYKAHEVNEILSYNYFDANGDTICYDFNKGFYGLLRITFRNAQKGEKVFIENNTYTCSGELDEQAIIRFTPSYRRKVTIYGDKHFRISHIANIEALNICPIYTHYW